jgi:hypothetical protein
LKIVRCQTVRDPSSEPRRFEIDRHRKKEVLIEGNELELLGSQYVYKLQDGKVEEDTLDVIAAFHDGVVYRLETSTVDTERRVSFNSVTAAKLERRRDCCVVQELYVKTSKTLQDVAGAFQERSSRTASGFRNQRQVSNSGGSRSILKYTVRLYKQSANK